MSVESSQLRFIVTRSARASFERSASHALTHTSGAFQLIATSLRLYARMSSAQHVCGAHLPLSVFATSSCEVFSFGPPEITPGGGGG